MEELEREEPLFERAVPMKIQMRDREDRTGDITVRIMAGKRVRFFWGVVAAFPWPLPAGDSARALLLREGEAAASSGL